MTDDKERPTVDLHESEWSRKDRPEPFWGHGSPAFFAYSIGSIIAVIIAQTTFAPFLYWLFH